MIARLREFYANIEQLPVQDRFMLALVAFLVASLVAEGIVQLVIWLKERQ